MNFSTNSWYRIVTTSTETRQLALAGYSLSGRQGALAFTAPNTASLGQQWQLFAVAGARLVLRTRASGPNGWLGFLRDNSSTPRMCSYDDVAGPLLWTIQPWGDGTVSLQSVDGGETRLLEYSNDGVTMGRSRRPEDSNQAFSLVRMGEIDDDAFSTVDMASVLQTVSETRSTTTSASRTVDPSTSLSSVTPVRTPSQHLGHATAPPTSSPSSSAEHPSLGLSPSAAMGVGVTVGALGLVFAVALGLFLYHGMVRRKSPEYQQYRQSKLWKGFTPHTPPPHKPRQAAPPSTGEMYLVEASSVTPPSSIIISPPLASRHASWTEWPSSGVPGSPVSPLLPVTPRSFPAELPA